jgi:hypothetical protein
LKHRGIFDSHEHISLTHTPVCSRSSRCTCASHPPNNLIVRLWKIKEKFSRSKRLFALQENKNAWHVYSVEPDDFSHTSWITSRNLTMYFSSMYCLTIFAIVVDIKNKNYHRFGLKRTEQETDFCRIWRLTVWKSKCTHKRIMRIHSLSEMMHDFSLCY